MDEEEQFVNIDLNDDNICSVCKLETDTGTLSFCHICFELSIEGVCTSTLLHSKSLRGHRDCFEKFHLIANQKLCRGKGSRSTYEGVKRALSQRLSRIVQLAQNRDASSETGSGRNGSLCYSRSGDCKLLPQSDTQVPRYAPHWADGPGLGIATRDTSDTHDYGKADVLGCHSDHEDHLGVELLPVVVDGDRRGRHNAELAPGSAPSSQARRHPAHSHEELSKMSLEELHQLNGQLIQQIQKVFEELSVVVQEKDSLSSQLHVRHIAIEQLFKNCSKLPWLQIGRAGVRASQPPVE
ncbi:protein EURL homolog isoform X2 [Engraulis encrasicolus]|uniref:protein EURL homolog isoform X2 n=1 Tax=Engraulis encrasicolus TaxID=184585 RepID=UPI002FCE9BE2